MRKNVFSVCRAGGYLDIAGPQQKQQGEEPLLPMLENYSTPEKSPLEALQGYADENNILLPTHLNARGNDTSEGQHGEHNQN